MPQTAVVLAFTENAQFASDLGWAPGVWPTFVVVTNPKAAPVLYAFDHIESQNGDCVAAKYIAVDNSFPSKFLTIFND